MARPANYIVLLLSTAISFDTSTASTKTYRSDYHYRRETDAFYKFHTESETNARAQMVCEYEGGSLMIVSSVKDTSVAHEMLKTFPDISEKVWIGDDGHEHDDFEGEIDFFNILTENQQYGSPKHCEVITWKGDFEMTPCSESLPFICKIEAKDAYYDPECGVFGKGFEYHENVGSCYKIPRIAYSWNQAYDDCDAQGAHLVIINSQLEDQVVHNLTLSARSVIRTRASWFFFIGIRAKKNPDGSQGVFKTINGLTLQEAGFDKWSTNEPNNFGGEEYCGTLFRNNGEFNDVNCSHLHGYICEKEIPSRRS